MKSSTRGHRCGDLTSRFLRKPQFKLPIIPFILIVIVLL